MTEFELGQVVVTASIDTRMKTDPDFNAFVNASLDRFKKCDWGILCDDDKDMSDKAVEDGRMILGAYVRNGEEIWIITEWNRCATTILFPHER